MKLFSSSLSLSVLLAGLDRALASSYRIPPQCSGRIVPLVIDFEIDANGRPLSSGDAPKKLPGGVKVKASRSKGSNVPPTKNDQLILDSANPRNDPDLRSDEGLVLIINNSDDPWIPDDNAQGGTVKFTFTQPIFQVKSVTLLDIDEQEPSFVSGSNGLPTPIPASSNGQKTTVFLTGFFNENFIEVELAGSGAIAKIELSICTDGAFPNPPPPPTTTTTTTTTTPRAPCPVPACVGSPCTECESRLCSIKLSFFDFQDRTCPGCPIADQCIPVPTTTTTAPCPVPSCSGDPCAACPGGQCKTKLGFIKSGDRKCPGCPELKKCLPPPTTTTTVGCPVVDCAIDPCAACPGGQCKTKLTFTKSGSLKCPGCPELKKCIPPPTTTTAPCPVVDCIVDPCAACPSGQCTTKLGFIKSGGRKCPTCPELKKCIPAPNPPPQPTTTTTTTPPSCPVVDCVADPCAECPSGQCKTKLGFFKSGGLKCPGCPEVKKCISPPNPPPPPPPTTTTTAPCPVTDCVGNPCAACPTRECSTKIEFFEADGRKCPGCPVLEKCAPAPTPKEEEVQCPVPGCLDPCAECESGNCITKPGFFESEGKTCPGCPEIRKCIPKRCPEPKCDDPCATCDSGICKTKSSSTYVGDRKCPGCEVLKKCIKPQCPVFRCQNPCASCPSGQCTSKKNFFDLGGRQCRGCDELKKCTPVPTTTAAVTTTAATTTTTKAPKPVVTLPTCLPTLASCNPSNGPTCCDQDDTCRHGEFSTKQRFCLPKCIRKAGKVCGPSTADCCEGMICKYNSEHKKPVCVDY